MPLVPLNSQQAQDYLSKNPAANAYVSNYLKGVAQPQAGLQSTELGNQQAGLDIQKTQATLPSDIKSAQARSTIDTNQADQLDFISKTKDAFDKLKGKDGYVSPETYNQWKADATKKNITGDAFDKTFSDNYTNPNNIYYDTAEMKPLRSAAKDVYNLIKTYHGLSLKGSPKAQWLADLYGKFGISAGGDTRAYTKDVAGLSGDIKNLVGAVSGSGFRWNIQELNRINSLLPTPSDTSSEANAKLDQLDEVMKTNFGVGLDDFINADGGSK